MTLPRNLDVPKYRFCLLAYKPKEKFHMQSHEGPNIILLVEDHEGLQVLVDPEWKSVVSAADQDFIGEIISDFALRAKSDKANLLEQTRFLGIGPLVTRLDGLLPTDDPLFLDANQLFKKM